MAEGKISSFFYALFHEILCLQSVELLGSDIEILNLLY